jgi:hypothetical protein
VVGFGDNATSAVRQSERCSFRQRRSEMKTTSARQQSLTTPVGRASGNGAPPEAPVEPDHIERTWWQDRRVAIGSGYVAMVTVIAWLYGVIPFSGRSVPLAAVATVTGWVDCLADGRLPCTYVGYPKGVDLSVAGALVTGAYLVTRLGIGLEAALNILSLVALAAGVASLWALAASIARSAAAGAIATALYFLSPIVISHTDKTALFLGFILLPLPLALAYAALKPNGRPLWVALGCVALTFGAGMVLVYLDPYAWAISVVLGGPLCIAGLATAAGRTWWRRSLVPLVTLIVLTAPGLIFRTLETSAQVSANFPLDFYRTFGADVATTVIPTRDSLMGEVIRSPVDRWDPLEFYGDGTNLTGAFIGIVTFVAAAAGLVWLFRRRRPDRVVSISLAVGGLACLALGLGPSLKLLDKASAPASAGAAPRYLMPASEATSASPWSWVYHIQPFEGMRAAYRWHVGLRLVLAIFAAAAIVWLFRRRRVLGGVLVALLILETTSHGMLDAREQARSNHEVVQRFEDDVDRAFGDGRLRASERVLFLPAGNDYLIGMIAPRFKVFAYNLSFDKELVRLRPGQPKQVVDVISAYNANTLNRDLVCRVFRKDLVDAVVFDDFDMRWDTLQWPPSQRRLEAHRTKNAGFGLFDDPAFSVDEGDLAVIVRPAPASPMSC